MKLIIQNNLSIINAFVNIQLIHISYVSARGNQSDPNSFTRVFFSSLARRISIFSRLIYAGWSLFFLEPVTRPWFYPMGHVESNISRSISARRLLGPAPPTLDFHRMHLRGLSPILSCRQLQTRRPITVSNGGEFGPRRDASLLRNYA